MQTYGLCGSGGDAPSGTDLRGTILRGRGTGEQSATTRTLASTIVDGKATTARTARSSIGSGRFAAIGRGASAACLIEQREPTLHTLTPRVLHSESGRNTAEVSRIAMVLCGVR